MTINKLNDILQKFYDEKNPLSLAEAIDLSIQAEAYYLQISKSKIEIFKDFNDNKNRFDYEIRPIIHTANYLKSRGEEPEKIIFCAKSETLACDGVFKWRDREVKVELTRAHGGDEGGLNEGLRTELLKEQGIAPLGQNINYSGTKRKRHFGDNDPIVFKDRYKTDIPDRLQKALDHKNNSKDSGGYPKYKGYWLILSVPLYELAANFHESCSLFWKEMYKKPIFFDRVFVISEEFIKCGDTISISNANSILNSDVISMGKALATNSNKELSSAVSSKLIELGSLLGEHTQIIKRTLENSLWDSHNDGHKVRFLLALSNTIFDSDDGKELRNLLLKISDALLIVNLDNAAKL